MRTAAVYLRDNREPLSRTLVDEMGKPIVQAGREVDRFAGRCEYFAEHAEAMLSPEHVPISGLDSWIHFEPMGVALGIMPWNFPFGQASRWAVPALMAANTAHLTPAVHRPLSPLAP